MIVLLQQVFPPVLLHSPRTDKPCFRLPRRRARIAATVKTRLSANEPTDCGNFCSHSSYTCSCRRRLLLEAHAVACCFSYSAQPSTLRPFCRGFAGKGAGKKRSKGASASEKPTGGDYCRVMCRKKTRAASKSRTSLSRCLHLGGF